MKDSFDHFREDIQGIRAIAVLMVMAFHAGLPVPGGFLGVDIFFVVSGFVITRMILKDINSGTFSFSRFYSNRFKRLAPSLGLMVTCVALFSLVFTSPLGGIQITIKSAVGALFSVANYVIFRITGGYFDPPAHTNPLLHTWSLSVEEQFYAVFPILFYLIYRVKFKIDKKRLLSACVLIGTIISLLSCFIWPEISSVKRLDFFFHFYGPIGRMWEFGFGALVALTSSHWKSVRIQSSLGLIGILLITFSLFIFNGTFKSPGITTVIPVIGTVFLLISGIESGNIVSRTLSHRFLVAVGDRSYALYLWHWPFVVLASTIWTSENRLIPVVATLLSIGPALFAHRFVEQPLRQKSVSARYVAIWFVPFGFLVPLVLVMGAKVAIDNGLWNTEVQAIQASALGRHVGSINGCDRMLPLSSSGLEVCSFNSPTKGMRIYLLGDSNADHFSEGVIKAGGTLGRPVIIRTANGCPFIDLYVDLGHGEEWTRTCHKFTVDTIEFLRAAAPSTVIVSNIDSYWRVAGFKVGLDNKLMTDNESKKLAFFRKGLQRTVETIQKAGREVILSQTIPYAGIDPKGCTTFRIILSQCSNDMKRAVLEKEQDVVRSDVRKVSKVTKARIFDPWDWMCSVDVCTTSTSEFFRYVNTNHISVPQSIDLAQAFTKILRH